MTRCFACNRIKQEEGNHWWAIYLSHTMPSQQMSLTIAPFGAMAGVEGSSYKPACGNNCTQKLVERWLITGSMDAPRAVGEPA
jgi:hypothetical protein